MAHRHRSVFAPVVGRSTSVVLAKKAMGQEGAGQFVLVTSASTRPTTEVIAIDLGTGLLAKNRDKFSDEASALAMLASRGYDVCLRGSALLGYVAAGGTAGVLLATRVRKKCTLPGGHAVYLVVDSQWVLIQLQNGASADPAAAAQGLAFWTTLQQYTLNNAHYYCETADLSRPFPSTHAASDPAPEFVWNAWLTEPLRSLGLADVCPVLLQGAIECSQETHPTGERYSLALLSRRSRRHPGTRYLARGLNEAAGPGNEIECELIMWTHPGEDGASGEPLQWARLAWRRGTVPIWWGVNLQSLQKGLQAEVYVREKEPYCGTITYFRSLQRQHVLDRRVEAAVTGDWTLLDQQVLPSSPQQQQQAATQQQPTAQQQQQQPGGGGSGGAAGPGRAPEDPSLQVPVTCVNLLHANPKKVSELMLSEHFHEAVRFARKRLGGAVPLKVVNFDWHGNMGRLTEEKGIEGFWSFMDPVLRQCGLAAGFMVPADEDSAECQPSTHSAAGSAAAAAAEDAAAAADRAAAAAAVAAEGPYTAWGPGWRMRWRQQQHGIVRFNCADSLDRTNAATCFAMLPALQEGLRLLGVPLDCGGLQSPGAAALVRGGLRAGSYSTTTVGSSAQDLSAVAGGRSESEAVREAAPAHMLQQDLPPGWDVVNHQGRLLYVDHINKRTSWTPPPMPKPAAARTGFMQSAADMFARLQRQSSPPRIGGGSAGHLHRPSTAGSDSRASSRSNSFASLGAAAGAGGASDSPQPAMPLSPVGQPAQQAQREAGGSPGPGSSSPTQRLPSSKSAGHLVAHAAASQSSPELRGGPGPGGGHHAHSVGAPSSRPSTASEATNAESPRTSDHDHDGAWGFFGFSVADVRERLFKEAVADYVEMFKVHGDIHSFLYTGSPAMHSHVLGLVVQGGKAYGATSGVGKLQNLRVAVQRRWNNTMSDSSRQQAVEVFLGLGLQRHFKGLDVLYPPGATNDFGALEPADLLPVEEGALHRSTELQSLPIQTHDGMLAVQQDLLDLEPLDEGDLGDSSIPVPAHHSRLAPHGSAEGEGGGSPLLGTAVARQRGEGEETQETGDMQGLLDPLGAGLLQQQQQGPGAEEGWEADLISLGGNGQQQQHQREAECEQHPGQAVAAQFQDLLL